jgi:hypothetical protein
MKCRKVSDDVETEVCLCPREEPGSDLLTAQVASGIEVARVWLRLCCGTWEPVVSKVTVGLGSDPPDRPREHPKLLKMQGAEYRREAQGRAAW